jgi:hypothetical protein
MMPLLLLVIVNIITPGSAGTVPGGLGYAQVLTAAISAFGGVAPRVVCIQVKWEMTGRAKRSGAK